MSTPTPSFYGTPIVWGVQEPKPIHGAPPGKMRLKMRNKDCAKLFIKTDDGIRHFILEDCGDHWKALPRLERGRNHRQPDAKRCTWKPERSHEYFDTECGQAFCLIDGTLKENHYHFCPNCGGAIEVKP